MSTKRTTDSAQSAIECLKKRFDALHTRRIQIQTQLDTEQKRLAELKLAAQSQFGTDDVGRLTEMLQELERANAEKVQAFQSSLDLIEHSLLQVEADTLVSNSDRSLNKP